MCVYVYVCVYIHTFKCGLPRGLSDIVSAYQCRDKGDTSWIPELGRSLGGGNGNLLQFSCLKNPMDRGAWQAVVHGVTKSQIGLNMQACIFFNYISFQCPFSEAEVYFPLDERRRMVCLKIFVIGHF